MCLSCFYIDGRAYQENELVAQNVKDGHDVLVIASTEIHSETGEYTYTEPGEYQGSDGARVIRLPYSRLLPKKIARKIRMHPYVYTLLEEYRPDSILFHGLCGWELLTVAKYARNYPQVLLYADCHASWDNSARGFVSRALLHKSIYRAIISKSLPQIRKVLCISTEILDFVRDVYGVSVSDSEFFPLGGRPLSDKEYETRRVKTRKEYGIDNEDILIVQSGKLSRRKKLEESLHALSETNDERIRLIICGVIQEEIRHEVEKLIDEDWRASFVGWKSTTELTDLLCAADVYLQPGTQSVTMQNSLCARCAVILDDVPAHKVYFNDNGWLTSESNDLVSIFCKLSQANLVKMREKSSNLALDILDYKSLSRRYLS
jgi:1,2-diacylglycerol 3-alpha-glucosyltransferase